jgi:hypothetical protein
LGSASYPTCRGKREAKSSTASIRPANGAFPASRSKPIFRSRTSRVDPSAIRTAVKWAWAQATAGGKGRCRACQRLRKTGKIVVNTRPNSTAGKVRRRWAKACWVSSRNGGTHHTASVRTTRTHSLMLPICRHNKLRTKATITGKVNRRARNPKP